MNNIKCCIIKKQNVAQMIMPFAKVVMEEGCCQRMKVRGVIIAGQSSVTTQYTPQIQLWYSAEASMWVSEFVCLSLFVL